MKRLFCIICSIVMICVGTMPLSSCGKKSVSTGNESTQSNDPVNITIKLTDGRSIKAELYPDTAPITVKNFVKLCDDNFYSGLIFHRVIDGFMIQCGGYDENMKQKKADSIKGEFSKNGVENNLSHKRGVLSMARTQEVNSASSQFFIVQKDSPHLDGQYAAFGKVTEGMDVVDEIAKVQTGTAGAGMSDVPVTPIVIESISIDK